MRLFSTTFINARATMNERSINWRLNNCNSHMKQLPYYGCNQFRNVSNAPVVQGNQDHQILTRLEFHISFLCN